MHLSFKNLAIIDILGFYASLMDIHHDTFFRSISEDDYISLTFKDYNHYCSDKRVRLWLIVKLSIHLFHVTNYTFTLTLHFHFTLIILLTSSFFMCECGHGLYTFDTHLRCCLFGG
jgi:hypothetical protein